MPDDPTTAAAPDPGRPPASALSDKQREDYDFAVLACETVMEIARRAELQLRELVAPLVLDDEIIMQIPHRASQYALDAQTLTENVGDLRNRIIRWRASMEGIAPAESVGDEL